MEGWATRWQGHLVSCACGRSCSSALTASARFSSDPKSPIPRKLQEWVDGVLAVQVEQAAARCNVLCLTMCKNSSSFLLHDWSNNESQNIAFQRTSCPTQRQATVRSSRHMRNCIGCRRFAAPARSLHVRGHRRARSAAGGKRKGTGGQGLMGFKDGLDLFLELQRAKTRGFSLNQRQLREKDRWHRAPRAGAR